MGSVAKGRKEEIEADVDCERRRSSGVAAMPSPAFAVGVSDDG